MEILPVINCDDERCVAQRAAAATELVGKDGWVSIDVADGGFTGGYATWRDHARLRALVGPDLKIELHLMVREPELAAPLWLAAGINRLIVHLETITSVEAIVQMCEEKKVPVVLGIAPETSADHAIPYLELFAGCHVLAVSPGLSGQVFKEEQIGKIAALRAAFPALPISVDGGVTLEVARRCIAAGATRFSVSSALWESSDPAVMFKQFQQL